MSCYIKVIARPYCIIKACKMRCLPFIEEDFSVVAIQRSTKFEKGLSRAKKIERAKKASFH